jgi:hypothetical protein
MKISTKYGFAFLCTPKCASTSLEAALHDLCDIHFSGHPKLKHINARTYTEKIRAIHQQIFPSLRVESFCLIRNPLDWMQSWYSYRSRAALKTPSHPSHRNYAGNISYNEFIESYIAQGERLPYAKMRSQYDFMRLENGEIGVDHIIPLDRIDRVIDFIHGKSGHTIKLPKLNKSPKRISIQSLDNALEEKLRQHLANDIALYNLAMRYETFSKTLHASEFNPA